MSLLLTLTLCGKDLDLAFDVSPTNFDTVWKDLDLAFDVSPTNFDTAWEGSGSSPSSLSL